MRAKSETQHFEKGTTGRTPRPISARVIYRLTGKFPRSKGRGLIEANGHRLIVIATIDERRFQHRRFGKVPSATFEFLAESA